MAVSLCALLLLATDARAELVVEQLTDDPTGASCGSYLPDESATGEEVAFESDCDLDGGNEDGSLEIYRVHRGEAPQQLSSATACSSGAASISADGSRVAFQSDCDFTGGNPDGNFEIFLWKDDAISQLTASTTCDNLAPSINQAGTRVSFDSDCMFGALNVDGSTEIFQVTDTGTVTALTRDAEGICDSFNASSDATGALVAYESDCDPVGTNEDFAAEIFTVTSSGFVKQITAGRDDFCSSVAPSMDAEGKHIAFQSDCDPAGANADGSQEIFIVDPNGVVSQLTDDSGQFPCSSSRPRLSSDGTAVAFSSYCDLIGDNADGSLEVFRVQVGQLPVQLTDGVECNSLVGSPSASAREVAFDSDCDLLGTNADGGTEIFRIDSCVCGAPATRRTPPLASDALFVLRAAVGLGECAPCECDTDSNDVVVASDALLVLSAAVGLPVTLTCPER